jgi:hypothetical protein
MRRGMGRERGETESGGGEEGEGTMSMGDEKGSGKGRGGNGEWGEGDSGGNVRRIVSCGGGSSSVYTSRPLSRGVMRTHFLRYSSFF